MYKNLIFIIGLAILYIIGIIIIVWNHKRDLSQQYKNQLKQKYQQQLDNEFQEKLRQLSSQQYQINTNQNQISTLNGRISSLDKEITEKIAMNKELKVAREEELNNFIETLRISKESKLDHEINDWAQSAQEAEEFAQNERLSLLNQEYDIKKSSYQLELDSILKDLESYRQKRQAINEEILRSRAVEEKQDFYSIQLPTPARIDIGILEEVRPRLSNRTGLDQLIYTNYIAKPVKEMAKRVLGGKDPSGIYKVTNIQTGEIYIGKSVNVATRWNNHCRSAFGLEGVADSQFQRALKKYSIFAFTWELLEEVPKENLKEREKYYIQFYDTTKYGYNMREG